MRDDRNALLHSITGVKYFSYDATVPHERLDDRPIATIAKGASGSVETAFTWSYERTTSFISGIPDGCASNGGKR